MSELTVEVACEELLIEDAQDLESWMKSLAPILGDIAENNWFDPFEPFTDIGIELERGIAKAVEAALRACRADQDLAWIDSLNEEIESALFPDDVLDRLEEWVFQLKDYHSLIRDIKSCIEENKVEIDIGALSDEIRHGLINELEKISSSRPIDAIKHQWVRFIYVPGYGVSGSSLDSFDLYTDRPHVSEREGLFAFCKLYRVRPISLIDHLGIDQEDTETIDKWIEHEVAFGANDYKSELASKAAYIIENAGVDYGIPMWIGLVKMGDIVNLDPRKEMHLKGGQAGIHNPNSGAGFIDSHPDENGIIIGADQLLTAEVGYGEESVYGITRQFLSASISNISPEENLLKSNNPSETFDGPDC